MDMDDDEGVAVWANAAVVDDRTDLWKQWYGQGEVGKLKRKWFLTMRQPKRVLLSRYVGGFIFERHALSPQSLLMIMQETPGIGVNRGNPYAAEAGGNATWGKYFDDDDLISYSYTFSLQESRAPGWFNTGDMVWWES